MLLPDANHVHLIVVPSDADVLRRTFADAHRRYTGYINARHCWTGHSWQGRVGAVVMDEEHLAHAMRYVSLNPVRARLAERAEDWRWSSVKAHLSSQDDTLVRVAPAIERYGSFDAFLGAPSDYADDAWRALRQSETSGRPLGGAEWMADLEVRTGRKLVPQKRGPEPKDRIFSKLAP